MKALFIRGSDAIKCQVLTLLCACSFGKKKEKSAVKEASMQPHDSAQHFNCFIVFKNTPGHRLAFRVIKISQLLLFSGHYIHKSSGAIRSCS